jgi:hypothetical protein
LLKRRKSLSLKFFDILLYWLKFGFFNYIIINVFILICLITFLVDRCLMSVCAIAYLFVCLCVCVTEFVCVLIFREIVFLSFSLSLSLFFEYVFLQDRKKCEKLFFLLIDLTRETKILIFFSHDQQQQSKLNDFYFSNSFHTFFIQSFGLSIFYRARLL